MVVNIETNDPGAAASVCSGRALAHDLETTQRRSAVRGRQREPATITDLAE